jgi:hypothetical protein
MISFPKLIDAMASYRSVVTDRHRHYRAKMIAGFCVRSVSGRNILPCSGPIAGGNDKKATAGFRTPARSRKSMIRKSGYRFSEKIMLKQKDGAG